MEIEGNVRIPAAGILRQVSQIPGLPFDQAKSESDIRRLHALGVFEQIQVESRTVAADGVDIVYRVREHPFVSHFSIEGLNGGLKDRVGDYLTKEKLDLRPATPFDPVAANKAALAVRDLLRRRKYPNAEVRVWIRKNGDAVRVSLCVQPGLHLEVGTVHFKGNASVPQSRLLHEMAYARPAPFWDRWRGEARYIPEELSMDLQRIRLYYRSQGFAAASVGVPQIYATGANPGGRNGKKAQLEIEIPIAEGPRYRLVSLGTEGDAKAGSADVQSLIDALQVSRPYDLSFLESTRQKIVDVMGRHGYALARVQLEQSADEIARTIRVVYKIASGDPVMIGRIDFRGNGRLPDKFLRRELRVSEGEVFNSARLDKSVRQLNKSNLVHKVDRSDIELKMNAETHLLDITFNVKEKERQGIYATGGTGGIGGGYLGIIYTAFNFLRLGETLSLEIDGGAAQSNMLLNIIGNRFLGMPFSLALSVFNRYTSFNVANIVPGPEALVGVLRRRSAGAGLTGSYSLTDDLAAGMGFDVGRDSISDTSTAKSDAYPSFRSGLSPFVTLDRTQGSGTETRGYRLSYSQALNGSVFLKSLDSTSESFQLAHYVGDPFTGGRNTLAFNLRGAWVRPHGDGPLFPERRFYPGVEIVRGFSHGSLSPWTSVPGSSTLQPAGSDSVLGFSAEYRAPVHGALSSAAFFDLAWTHLDPKDASQLGAGARLVERTNGILRASLGSELRLQLPVLHQPARFIFAWNPLRLNTLVGSPSSVLRMAEPRTSLRFALGTLY